MIRLLKNTVQGLSFYILGNGICLLENYECPKSFLDVIIANNLLIIFSVGMLMTLFLSRADKRRTRGDYNDILDKI